MRRRNRSFPTRFAERKRNQVPSEFNIHLKRSRLADFGTIISALSTFGILALAVWTAYFSEFSKVVVENLTKQNSELRQEKAILEKETTILENRQSELRKQITSSSKKLADLEIDAKSKQEKLVRLSREIEDNNSKIDALSVERISLSEQTNKLKSELIEKQKTLFLSRLPIEGRKYSGIPYYLLLTATDGISMSMDGSDLNGKRDSLSTYAEAAYNEMTQWLADMDNESLTPHQRSAYAFILSEFNKRCGNKSKWMNEVINPDDSELDFIHVERLEFEHKLSKIEDKMERLVAQSEYLEKQSEHYMVESKFYIGHMSKNVSKCFKF